MVKPNRKPDSRLLPGQSMVEFALIAPLLFTILFVILQLGLVMAGSTGVNHAALEGARTATIFGAQSIGADPYYGDSRICQSIMSSLSHDGINISSLGTVTIFNPADSTLRDEGA